MNTELFNPLDKRNLGLSIAVLMHDLALDSSFEGI